MHVPWMSSILVLTPLLILAVPAPAHSQANSEVAEFYVVSQYDEARDPAADLAMAVDRAEKEGKRILLEVGGTWCSWCKRLDLYIHDHASVSDRLRAGFLVVKVNWSPGNRNEAFLSTYPAIRGYPHIFVLEKDGTFLHSQNTGDLEEGPSYNEAAVLSFLDQWAPPTGNHVVEPGSVRDLSCHLP